MDINIKLPDNPSLALNIPSRVFDLFQLYSGLVWSGLVCPVSPGITVLNNSAYIFRGMDRTWNPMAKLVQISAKPGTENEEWVTGWS